MVNQKAEEALRKADRLEAIAIAQGWMTEEEAQDIRSKVDVDSLGLVSNVGPRLERSGTDPPSSEEEAAGQAEPARQAPGEGAG